MLQPTSPEAAPEAPALLRLDAGDDVAVALRALAPGERMNLEGVAVEIAEAIPHGHKVALRDLGRGEEVRKYGRPIGRLTAAVAAGAHIHSHNLETLLDGVGTYRFAPGREAPLGEALPLAFQGYRRADGRVGTRNEIWILPTVGCVARTAERSLRSPMPVTASRSTASSPSAIPTAARSSARIWTGPAPCSPLWPAIPMPAAC